MAGLIYAILLGCSVFILLAGLVMRLWQYSRIPAPLNMPTMPAPTTRSGVVLRLCREVVLFESLFKASKWTWLFGWIFHAGLLFVLLAHLRFFVSPVWGWVNWISPYSRYAGVLMFVGLAGLLCRRIAVHRVRYISAPSDYLMLLLLLGLAGTGLLMRYVFFVDLFSVNRFALALTRFEVAYLPTHPALLLHLFFVCCLLTIFPFSKLLHAPGLFFSPSRNQMDKRRGHRETGQPVGSQTSVRDGSDKQT